MHKLGIILSHRLTDKQIEDAKKTLNITEFIYLPDDLQQLWSNIPPEMPSIKNYLYKIFTWIEMTFSKSDAIIVQGDFGAVYLIVSLCKQKGLRVVYSTTKRNTEEIHNSDGTVDTMRTFEHVIFRDYEDI